MILHPNNTTPSQHTTDRGSLCFHNSSNSRQTLPIHSSSRTCEKQLKLRQTLLPWARQDLHAALMDGAVAYLPNTSGTCILILPGGLAVLDL